MNIILFQCAGEFEHNPVSHSLPDSKLQLLNKTRTRWEIKNIDLKLTKSEWVA